MLRVVASVSVLWASRPVLHTIISAKPLRMRQTALRRTRGRIADALDSHCGWHGCMAKHSIVPYGESVKTMLERSAPRFPPFGSVRRLFAGVQRMDAPESRRRLPSMLQGQIWRHDRSRRS